MHEKDKANEEGIMESGQNPITAAAFENCRLCPRSCGIDRRVSSGYCGCTSVMRAARAALHHWEEPCISGIYGSGTVFFCGCTLRCCFCQNHPISQGDVGKELSVRQLADIFLRLQEEKAHNINLVTASQYLPLIVQALDLVRHRLHIPVVYNCGGYERVEIIHALKDYVDIWLPDLKYYDPELSKSCSGAADYFACASQAVLQMIRQTGAPDFHMETGVPEKNGKAENTDGRISCRIMDRGVIIRHMVLPGHKEDSIRLLFWMSENLPKGSYYISLLSQYTPFYKSSRYPGLNRRVTTYEYQKVVDAALELGLDQGFIQQKSSAKEEYTPPFDLEGI